MNGLSNPYHLDESTLILGASGVIFYFYFISMKIKIANRIAPDGTQRFAVSHLGLFCLPMSHKKDARLIWVKHVLFWILIEDLFLKTKLANWSSQDKLPAPK